MLDKIKLFRENQKAIEDRVMGATMEYWVWAQSGERRIDGDSLQKSFNGKHTCENFVHYYNDTINRVAQYFRNPSTSGSWTDFQCNLAIAIYADYV